MKGKATKKSTDGEMYNIAVKNENGYGYVWRQIPAIPIKIKGWEEFKFIYHHSQELFLTRGRMVISEKECGALVGSGNTKRECLTCAIANLNTVSKDQFRAKIRQMKLLVKGRKK